MSTSRRRNRAVTPRLVAERKPLRPSDVVAPPSPIKVTKPISLGSGLVVALPHVIRRQG